MKLTFQEVLKNLKSKEYKPIYLLHGDESYFIDAITKHIETKVLQESEKAFNFSVLYGRDISHINIMDAARRYPMMAPLQVIIIKEAQDMKDLIKLEKYVANPTPTTLLLICHKHKKLDMRTKFAKTLSKNAVVFESKKLYDNKVGDWIITHLKSMSYSIEPNAAQMIAEYLGTNLSKIVNEMDKLVLNLPKGTKINADHVQKNIGISKEYNVFELQNALGVRNVLKCNRIINYFIANPKLNPLPKITGALYNYFSKVFITSSMKQAADNDLAKALGLRSAWFVKDYKMAARNYSRQKLEDVFHQLHVYDLRSKGVNNDSVAEGELIRELVYKILH